MSNLPVGAAVRYFMQLVGQPVPNEPTLLSENRMALRRKLIMEEWTELNEAYFEHDHAAFLDACVDLVYVIVGTAVEAGLPFDEAFAAVHLANMKKLTPCEVCRGTGFETLREMTMYSGPECMACEGLGGRAVFRHDGKVMKPVGWQAPDIAAILEREKDAQSAVGTT